ncbi:hypothetical protein [Brevifollis gellanilyticus]|uniref:DUF4397 domain-containing protein n=1 Tax=Brevifollis gellanilyticus TaxID=748831 RepID=A0A512MF41_9BACT|nr:hypothetical protein [Brevifollis gellanilyticus]GEP45342.1 hypothetical protein BGE01nite_46330 [Brevifollis gellanilyticus]
MKTTTKTTFLSLLALALAAAPQVARANANTFANATVITDSNQSNGSAVLLNYDAEAGEPGHFASGSTGAQKTAWWRWTAPSAGFCTVDTFGGDYVDSLTDTIIAVYTGAAVNNLTRVSANDDHHLSINNAAHFYSSTTFYATQGTTYSIAVDGWSAGSITANSQKVSLRLRHLPATPETRYGTFGSSTDVGMNGSIQLSRTATHAFSAKLNLAGKLYPFNGVFGLDGYFTISFERKVPVGSVPLPPLTLILDGAQNGMFGVVSGTANMERNLGTVQRFTAIQPSAMKGLYTATVSSAGTLSLNVSNLGVVNGAAVMLDGTKATFGSFLCKETATTCLVPTYTPLHTNTGFFYSYLQITEAGATDTLTQSNALAYYKRPAKQGATFYPAGISTSLSVVGSTYIPPMANARALGFLDGSMGAGKLTIAMQNPEITPAITENLTLGTNNVFKFTSPLQRKPVLALNKANGLVTGSIYDQNGKKRTITGILYREGMNVKLKGQLSGFTLNPIFEVVP